MSEPYPPAQSSWESQIVVPMLRPSWTLITVKFCTIYESSCAHQHSSLLFFEEGSPILSWIGCFALCIVHQYQSCSDEQYYLLWIGSSHFSFPALVWQLSVDGRLISTSFTKACSMNDMDYLLSIICCLVSSSGEYSFFQGLMQFGATHVGMSRWGKWEKYGLTKLALQTSTQILR